MKRANLPTGCVLVIAMAVTGSAQLTPPAREIPLYPNRSYAGLVDVLKKALNGRPDMDVRWERE